MPVSDKRQIREMNENLVMNIIISEKTISRADISKNSGLNKASVSSIVSTFIEKNLVKELGSGESAGGRKPIMVSLDEKCGASLFIDLGENYIKYILSYLDGVEILKKETITFKITKKNIIRRLSKIIKENIDEMPTTNYGIIGICIAVHGIVDNNKVLFSPFYNIESLNIKEDLEIAFNIPVHLENEANLSALGENMYNENKDSLISISVHTGIGAGIILNNELYKGTGGYAGEIGHMIAILNGRKCSCGNKGCIEKYASESSILKLYSKKKNLNELSFEVFQNNYLLNEKLALETMDIFIKFISIAINNLITTFNPKIIIINSRFTNEIVGITNKIRNNLAYKMNNDTILKSSKLKENSILLGGFFLNRKIFLMGSEK